MTNEKFDRAPQLETERLLLRPHAMKDFEPLATMFQTSHAKFVGGPCDREKTWRIFAADVGQWALLGFGPWAIELRESGEIIGQVAPRACPA